VTAPVNTSKRATRNFEIDKTISHTKQPTGTIKRVTVAVVVDDIVNFDKKGKMLRKSRTPEDIERFNTLVKEAIGFDEKRGDRVNVVNAAFSVPPAAQPLPEVPLWKQEWTWDIAKQVGGAIAALMVLLLVVKPLLKGLMARPVGTAPMALAEDRVMLGGGATPQLGAPAQSYDQQVTNAKTLAGQDPRRVAQVVKNWVATDG
jgi:flagellar M-ring protein FliF